ncbi:hypothetical protein [Nocardia flavorosea]|uniref:Uncharacterized protein n=1 Tax=Nocardia flavorosea TaxID=53429 RepID=A0A846YJD5_9NOCA|nr:hypothetical protein [Nocardia flavorosea]NKY57921.1 hypothetical protein [Nocardia flavorosea]
MGQPATPGADTLGRLHGDQLAETPRRFTAAWQDSPARPDLTQYLPRPTALRRVALIEVVKIDLVQRRRCTGQDRRLADHRVLIIDDLDPGAHETFQRVAPFTYGLAFLAGFVVTTVLTAPLGSVLRGLRRGGSGRDSRSYDNTTPARARRDTLLLSSRTVPARFPALGDHGSCRPDHDAGVR